MRKIITTLVVCLGLVACGGESDDNNDDRVVISYDGTYAITVNSTTPTATDGGACAESASGSLVITDSSISGNVVDSNGQTYTLNGSVDSDGDISGGFASNGQNVVSFDGLVFEDEGVGTYKDIFDCEGTWVAEKQ